MASFVTVATILLEVARVVLPLLFEVGSALANSM
jgi:hypothetical protein